MNRRNFLVCAALAVSTLTAGIAVAGNGNGKGPKPKQVVVNGAVTSVNGASFVVHRKGGGRNGVDVTVNTTETTTYRKSDGGTAVLADVVVGAKVQVKGTSPSAGVVDAKGVMIKVPDAE
jgi:hypothetical protein